MRCALDSPENPCQAELLCDHQSRDRYLVFAWDGPWCDFLLTLTTLYNWFLAGRVQREKARKAEWNPARTSKRKWNNS
jgi:hypothetical protein